MKTVVRCLLCLRRGCQVWENNSWSLARRAWKIKNISTENLPHKLGAWCLKEVGVYLTLLNCTKGSWAYLCIWRENQSFVFIIFVNITYKYWRNSSPLLSSVIVASLVMSYCTFACVYFYLYRMSNRNKSPHRFRWGVCIWFGYWFPFISQQI